MAYPNRKPNPDPDELEQRLAEIRAGWSRAERLLRLNGMETMSHPSPSPPLMYSRRGDRRRWRGIGTLFYDPDWV